MEVFSSAEESKEDALREMELLLDCPLHIGR